MATYVLTSSLSEFRINPDQSIDRMSVMATRFSPWAPAGSKWGTIRIGEPITGTTDRGPFTTSRVVSLAHVKEGSQ